MCWEQHKGIHPVPCIDPSRFAGITTGRWKTMTKKQKNPFFHMVDDAHAFKVFATLCWEKHKEMHPDPTRFAEITAGRWKTMTLKQKNACFDKFQEDEERKVKKAKRKNVFQNIFRLF